VGLCIWERNSRRESRDEGGEVPGKSVTTGRGGSQPDRYLFSRSGWPELPDVDAVSLATGVFYQFWRTRADPFHVLEEGDIVYIGDPASRRILWEVRVANLLKSNEPVGRNGMFRLLRLAYGMYASDLNGYPENRPGDGWVLAWGPKVMRNLNVSMPEGVWFGRNGYRRLRQAEILALDLPEPKQSRSPLGSPPPWYDVKNVESGKGAEVPRYIPLRVREKVAGRDGYRCVGCGTSVNLHFDHIKPFSYGGLPTVENLRLVCANSNLRRGVSDAKSPLSCERGNQARRAGRRL
jgi:hypothetical protein